MSTSRVFKSLAFASSLLTCLLGVVPAGGGVGAAVPTIAPCSTDDVLTLIGKDGPYTNAPGHAAIMIRNRIAACHAGISGTIALLPSPYPTSVNPYASKYEEPQTCASPTGHAMTTLYDELSLCVSYLKSLPSPPKQMLPFRAKQSLAPSPYVLYAFSASGDAPTNAMISARIAQRVIDFKASAYTVVSEGTWNLDAFTQQCQTDLATAGAILAMPTASHSSTDNYLLLQRSWTMADLQLVAISCDRAHPYLAASTGIGTQSGSRWSVPLGSLAAIASSIAAFHPIRTESTMNTYAVASPAASPMPGATVLTSVQTNDQQQTNSNSQLVILASQLLTPLSSVNVGQTGTTDSQTAKATDKAVTQLVAELRQLCKVAEVGCNDWFK